MCLKLFSSLIVIYILFSVKWVVVRWNEEGRPFSEVLKATDVEEEQTGLCLQEGADLKIGSPCMAKWRNGHMYEAEIILIGGTKLFLYNWTYKITYIDTLQCIYGRQNGLS